MEASNRISNVSSLEAEESDSGINLNIKGAIKEAVISSENIKTNVTKSIINKETISQQAEELIEQVNLKRKRDTMFLSDLKNSLEIQVKKSYGMIEQQMLVMYNKAGKDMETKLTELFAILERVSNLEQELQQFRNMLHNLYQDTQH